MMVGWDGLGAWQSDSRAWSDVAADRNADDVRGYQPNPKWSTPTADDNPWQSPEHTRMFHDPDPYDDPGRAFTTRKKHGWWGKEERFDSRGRKIS